LKKVAGVLALLVAANGLAADTLITPTITGNQLTARIELGALAADLSITFEQVVGLNVSALQVSAGAVSISDPTILSRLPGSLVSIPAGFPVLVRIEPSASSALSFAGVYKLGLHTHNLTFTANSPLRLYRSHAGGPFVDMTGSLEMGSVRAGGSGPGFSEFLIVADVRPTDSVIAQKLQTLETALASNQAAISAEAYTELAGRLQSIRTQITTGAIGPAIDACAAFGEEVKKRSGSAIPDVWQAHGTVVNVAGILRSAADTLRFSLVVKSNG